MKIANEFTVNAPVEQAWEVLTDLEQVVPLMPGAQMVGWEGDDFLGKLKVKVGPVTSEFTGRANFVERDEHDHRAVINGSGRDSRGSGNAAATITTRLREDGDKTHVTVDTDLKIVGKLAQFGSGMLQQVSEKLIGQFVTSLEAKLAGGDSAAAAAIVGPDSRGMRPQPVAQPEPAPLDLVDLVGPAMIKKYAPAIAFVLAAALAIVLVRRQMRGKR
ncbi:SRPBCC family protein [Nocardia sp. NBC_00565]|uniref:SRPBCC family protein n=1 Tax=Nocardia sp. NBC_00565 TaxID=2975993 RepID=UPI002E81C031|nr:SRPBCC family protein [Nocardia sp. NBC_00565]WUC06486.1 SRPBCC family protein [Nocardia sp. NBC_00565]